MKHRGLVVGSVVALLVGLLFTSLSVVAVVVAVVAGYAILRLGFMALGSMARPIPEPPPAGELRKVKIAYRCTICGTEVRMTVANDQMPDPPRHCLDEMELMTPVDDL